MNNGAQHNPVNNNVDEIPGIQFVDYKDESQLEYVMSLVVSWKKVGVFLSLL